MIRIREQNFSRCSVLGRAHIGRWGAPGQRYRYRFRVFISYVTSRTWVRLRFKRQRSSHFLRFAFSCETVFIPPPQNVRGLRLERFIISPARISFCVPVSRLLPGFTCIACVFSAFDLKQEGGRFSCAATQPSLPGTGCGSVRHLDLMRHACTTPPCIHFVVLCNHILRLRAEHQSAG